MTDLQYQPSLITSRAEPRGARANWIAILYVAGLVAGGIGATSAIMHGAEAHGIEWQLALLMRFMAGVKALMVVGALRLTHWRLLRPIGAPLATGYVAGIALMALAPGLIWSMDHIVAGAACFHAGLLLYLVLAWRDGAVQLRMTRR